MLQYHPILNVRFSHLGNSCSNICVSEWATNQSDYMLSIKNSTAQKVTADTNTILYSNTNSYVCGHTIIFKVSLAVMATIFGFVCGKNQMATQILYVKKSTPVKYILMLYIYIFFLFLLA